jgi:hypothetical protein
MSASIGPSLAHASRLSEHLSHDNAAIDQGMDEAREKADVAMTAAQTGLVMGIAQGLVSIGSAAVEAAQPKPMSRQASGLADRVPIDGLHAVAQSFESSLDSLSEMGEMESLRLQMAMDRLSKLMSTLSNLMHKASDTQSAIVQNMK